MKIELTYSKHNIKFNDEIVEVYEKISTSEKIALITVAIETSLKYSSIPSRIAFEGAIGALICFKYSNIEVEDLSNKDILYAYDVFKDSGFLPLLIKEIDKQDYEELIKYADQTFETAMVYYNSGASVLETIIKLGLTNALEKTDTLN